MINRIELILKTQNLTPTQFADAIGIQRSSMSHILARRNNPSLDFVMKLLNRFPEINAEWLLSGKNQMFNTSTPHPALSSAQTPQTNLHIPEFEWNNSNIENKITDAAISTGSMSASKNATADFQRPLSEVQASVPKIHANEKILPVAKQDLNQNSNIERIIVFFTDGTFKSYS
jgi:transcriptional regulator with XRE-family HTH domain